MTRARYNSRSGDPRGPGTVQSALKAVLSKYNLDRDIARYEFVTRWKDIVGEEIAKRTWPECIRGGSLVVAVSSSAWAQELTFNKPMILKRLQRYTSNEDTITDVVFYVGELGRAARR